MCIFYEKRHATTKLNIFMKKTYINQTNCMKHIYTSCTQYIRTCDNAAHDIMKDFLPYRCPKQDLNLDRSKITVFEDCNAIALTTEPPRLDLKGFIVFVLFPADSTIQMFLSF